MKKIFLFFFPIFLLAQGQEKKEEQSNLTSSNKTLTSFYQLKNIFDDNDNQKLNNLTFNLSDAGKTTPFLGSKNNTSYSLYSDPGVLNYSENMKNTRVYNLYDSRPLKYLNNYLDKHSDK
jgi:hypothetical protein